MRLGGNQTPLGDQESVSCDCERDVVVEAAPASTFIVAKTDLLFEFLIIPLNSPSQLGLADEVGELDTFRQGRESVFGRFDVALRPLDKEPFLSS